MEVEIIDRNPVAKFRPDYHRGARRRTMRPPLGTGKIREFVAAVHLEIISTTKGERDFLEVTGRPSMEESIKASGF